MPTVSKRDVISTWDFAVAHANWRLKIIGTCTQLAEAGQDGGRAAAAFVCPCLHQHGCGRFGGHTDAHPISGSAGPLEKFVCVHFVKES